jgi:DNA-directed RNA polymerase specialized sigma24 family protein
MARPTSSVHINADRLVHSASPHVQTRAVIAEWQRIAHRPATLRKVNAWPFMPKEVDDLDQVLELCGFGRPIDDSEADKMLWHMVVQARTDELACQVVFHRMLPSLIAIARRRGKQVSGGITAAMGEVMGAAYFVIRTFPYERRAHKIASNIARDTEYHAFTRETRLVRVPEVHLSDAMMAILPDDDTPMSSWDELAWIISEAENRGLDSFHAEILRDLGNGLNSEEIGERIGKKPRTVRNHRRAAIDSARDVLRVP